MRILLRAYGPIVAFLLTLYLLYRYLLPVVLPFAIAAALAMLIEPVVGTLERYLKVPRGLGVAFTLLALFGLVLLFLFVGISRIAAEVRLLLEAIPYSYSRMEADVLRFLAQLSEWLGTLPPAVQEALEQQRATVIGTARVWLMQVAAGLQGLLAALPELLIQLLIVGLATFFISRDKQVVLKFLLELVPEPWRDAVAGMGQGLYQAFMGFVAAMVVLVLLTAMVTTVGLMALGSRYALLLGAVAGLLDVLPVVGPSLLFVPWGLYHVVFGELFFGVGLLVLWGVVTGFRALLQAQIIGERIGLHPLTTLLALYAGIRIFGPSGFVLGPLTAVLLKASAQAGLLPWGGRR